MQASKGVFAIVGLVAALGISRVASATEAPSGTDLADGIVVHVSPTGVHFLEEQVKYVVPPQIDVPNQGPTKLFSCPIPFVSDCYWKLLNTVVYVTVTKVTIVPVEGAIQLHLELSASADARVETNGCLFNNGCQVHLPESPVVADATIALSMVNDPATGRPKVVASLPVFATQLNLQDPEFSSCFLDTFLNFFIGLFHGTIQDAVNGAINNQVGPLLQPAIEDAFNSLNLNGNFNLAGSDLGYDFYPSGLDIHPGTIGIRMTGHFASATAAACIDPNRGSTVIGGAVPAYGAMTPSGATYDAAISLSDDLVNQLVFSAWRGGLLCRNIDSAGGSPLSNDMLTLVGGDLMKILTPGGQLVVHIEAQDPPLVILGAGGNTAQIDISNLKVDLMGEVQERLARVMRLSLGTTAGLDVSMNAQHQLVITPNFDPNAVQGTVEYNELAPDASATILTLLPTLVGALVPNLASAIPPIDLPAMAGITLDSTELASEGAPSGTYLSVYTGLGGHVDLAGGCGAGTGGGCGVGTGTTGCSLSGERGLASTRLVSPMMLAFGIGAVVARRRKSRDA